MNILNIWKPTNSYDFKIHTVFVMHCYSYVAYEGKRQFALQFVHVYFLKQINILNLEGATLYL